VSSPGEDGRDGTLPQLERFAIVREIGGGSMGIVYEAHDRENGSRVALKTMRTANAKALYRFKQEFRGLQGIEHPNLVQLGELYETDGAWFFTMEYVEGMDFLSYVRAGSYDESRLHAAFGALASGLSALHAAGKVHRDIKPSNVLITPQGRVVILDFGLLADKDALESSHNSPVGTAAYMAPEQALARPVDAAADWYAVGVLLYEVLTGQLPFEGGALQILMEKQEKVPASPQAVAPSVPDDLSAFCMELLQIDAAARPSGRAVLETFSVSSSELAFASTPTFTQTTPFVGREDELAALRDALERSRHNAVAAFVHGESGIGKSELVRHFAETAQAIGHDVVVLTGRCYERESGPDNAFDGVADALSQYMARLSDVEANLLLPRRADMLAGLFPVLRRVEAIARAPAHPGANPDPQELRTRMFAALRELLVKLSQRHPVALIIDDAQWADADSSMLLREVLDGQDAPRVLLVATVRTSDGGGLAEAQRLAGTAEVRHIELAGLSAARARELAQLLSPGLARDGAATMIAQEAGGHPLFIQEMVRHLETRGVSAGSTRLEDSIRERISLLPDHCATLLEIVCVAGAPITQLVASYATRQDFAEFQQAVSLLRISYLVRTTGAGRSDQIEPYHGRVSGAVLAPLEQDVIVERHDRLATALERAGAARFDPLALVRHAEAAGHTARASLLAERAGEVAGKALAFDQAAALFETALRLSGTATEGRERVRSLQLRLADALVHAGHGTAAADVFLTAADGADPTTRMECQRRAAEQLLISGHIDRGLEAVSAVLGEVGATLPSSSRLALGSLLWQRLKLRLRGRRWTRRHEKQISPEVLTRLDVYQVVGHGLGVVDTVRGMDFHARHLLLALRTGEEVRVGTALAYEACLLAATGARGAARAGRVLVEARRVVEDSKADYLIAWLATAEGYVAYLGSQFPKACERLETGEKRFRDLPGTAWELNNVRLARMLAIRYVGDFTELRSRLARYVRDAAQRGDRFAETSMRRTCTPGWLAADDLDAARDNLERATWMPPKSGFHLQHWWELEALCEIALYEGRAGPQAAELAPSLRELESSLLMRVQIVRVLTRWLSARVSLATTAPSAPVDRKIRRIADQLCRERMGYATVFARLLAATVDVRGGDRESAVARLREGAEVADEHGMRAHAAAARRRVGELIGGDEGAATIAGADESMVNNGVVNPERMTQLLTPGL
jgi:hypothetical protein